jgi:hypothetical protein
VLDTRGFELPLAACHRGNRHLSATLATRPVLQVSDVTTFDAACAVFSSGGALSPPPPPSPLAAAAAAAAAAPGHHQHHHHDDVEGTSLLSQVMGQPVNDSQLLAPLVSALTSPMGRERLAAVRVANAAEAAAAAEAAEGVGPGMRVGVAVTVVGKNPSEAEAVSTALQV